HHLFLPTPLAKGLSTPFLQTDALACVYPSSEDGLYDSQLALARTFTTLDDVQQLYDAGLIKGGSPANALIAEDAQYYNPPLRYSNEPVRHKMCDLIGDLALLGKEGNGGLPVGHVVAYKAGHDLHVRFARELLAACKKSDVCETPTAGDA
ncbi:hypothetical protein CYMTET_53406, partial [Cymbomonas tetramitiformis]